MSPVEVPAVADRRAEGSEDKKDTPHDDVHVLEHGTIAVSAADAEAIDAYDLKKAWHIAIIGGCVILTCTVIFGFCFAASGYIFSRGFFTFWVVLVLCVPSLSVRRRHADVSVHSIWIIIGACCGILYPIWESRDILLRIAKVILLSCSEAVAADRCKGLGRQGGGHAWCGDESDLSLCGIRARSMLLVAR
jgi:hypothetical protein